MDDYDDYRLTNLILTFLPSNLWFASLFHQWLLLQTSIQSRHTAREVTWFNHSMWIRSCKPWSSSYLRQRSCWWSVMNLECLFYLVWTFLFCCVLYMLLAVFIQKSPPLSLSLNKLLLERWYQSLKFKFLSHPALNFDLEISSCCHSPLKNWYFELFPHNLD